MSVLIPVALLGWPFVTLALFAILRPQKAFVASTVSGWLLLPVETFSTSGFIDIDKYVVIALSGFLAAILFDFQRLMRFKLSLLELPPLLWCFAGIPASLTNNLGLYDGLSISLRTFLHWGAFWVLGRIYLSDLKGLLLFTKALFIAGLAYAPLCLWEVRMSPSLHANLYGVTVYEGITYAQDLGKWGSRPSVFLKNPLELGMFLTSACISGYALARTRSHKTMFGLPTAILVAALMMVALMCKNLGATMLLTAGIAAIETVRRRKSLACLLVLALVTPTYVALRATAIWDGEAIAEFAQLVHEQKGQSFAFRLKNENLLVDKALQKPLFGWGAWGRWRVYDESGKDISIADGLWVITLGQWGLLGLSLLLVAMSAPALSLRKKIDRRLLASDAILPVLVQSTMVLLLFIDFLANDFPSPLILTGAGAILALSPVRDGTQRPAGRATRRSSRLNPNAPIRPVLRGD